jgi:diaminobutyrate-2-oxoglutarate transaminase
MSVSSVNPATNTTNEYYLTRQSQMESNDRSYPRQMPLAIAKALGGWVTEVERTEYLDR